MSSADQKINLNQIERYRPLSQKVASKYLVVGKKLGLTKAELEKHSWQGCLTGYITHLKKRHEINRKKYKVSTYLTWWMRRQVHSILVKKIIHLSQSKPDEAFTITMELLE